jgi:hypothetical protein
MPLHLLTDVSAADWIARPDADDMARILMGPPGFEAYARVLYPLESDAPDSDLVQRARARVTLARHTSTPDHCYFGLWHGNGADTDWEQRSADIPRLAIPHRDYYLFEGPLADGDDWGDDGPDMGGIPAHLEWPADQAWFVAGDVDPDWFAVGGTPQLIDELLADDSLDVVPATYGPNQPEDR